VDGRPPQGAPARPSNAGVHRREAGGRRRGRRNILTASLVAGLMLGSLSPGSPIGRWIAVQNEAGRSQADKPSKETRPQAKAERDRALRTQSAAPGRLLPPATRCRRRGDRNAAGARDDARRSRECSSLQCLRPSFSSMAPGAPFASGIVLHGHQDACGVRHSAPTAKRIVTASSDKTARLWDAEPASPSVSRSKHAGGLLSAAFSPDGRPHRDRVRRTGRHGYGRPTPGRPIGSRSRP